MCWDGLNGYNSGINCKCTLKRSETLVIKNKSLWMTSKTNYSQNSRSTSFQAPLPPPLRLPRPHILLEPGSRHIHHGPWRVLQDLHHDAHEHQEHVGSCPAVVKHTSAVRPADLSITPLLIAYQFTRWEVMLARLRGCSDCWAVLLLLLPVRELKTLPGVGVVWSILIFAVYKSTSSTCL